MSGKNAAADAPAEQRSEPGADAGSGVDDVRRVRERIAREHGGDVAAHVAETNRLAEELRMRVPLGRVVPPPENPRRGGTGS